MTKLKLTGIDDDKPVKLTVTLPAALHRNLVAYAEILAKETGKSVDPAKLVVPMLEKFIASDRGFRKARHEPKPESSKVASAPKPFPKSALESTVRFPPSFPQSDKTRASASFDDNLTDLRT